MITILEYAYEKAKGFARRAGEALAAGDPLGTGRRPGPLASETQRETVRQFILDAVDDGAELNVGGATAPENHPVGYFVRPTVLGQAERVSALAQQEVFGPVLALMTYRDEPDALDIENNAQYGLHGAVWSPDTECASTLLTSTLASATSKRRLMATRNLTMAGKSEERPGKIPESQGHPDLTQARSSASKRRQGMPESNSHTDQRSVGWQQPSAARRDLVYRGQRPMDLYLGNATMGNR